jgi:hypothetical protein
VHKILEIPTVVPAFAVEDSANHWPNDEPIMGPVLAGKVRSCVHINAEGKGMFFNDLNFNCTFAEFGHSMSSISHESNINDVGSCLHTTMVGSLEKTHG